MYIQTIETGDTDMTKMITTDFGHEFAWDAVVNLMDDDIREGLADGWDESDGAEEEFFAAYCAKHLEKFGETFVFAEENPQV